MRNPWSEYEVEQCSSDDLLSFNFIGAAVNADMEAAKQLVKLVSASPVRLVDFPKGSHGCRFETLGSSQSSLSAVSSSGCASNKVPVKGAKRSLFTFTGASSGVSSIFHNKYPSYNSYSSGGSVDFVMNRVVAKQKTEKKATGLRKWIRILVKKTPQSSL